MGGLLIERVVLFFMLHDMLLRHDRQNSELCTEMIEDLEKVETYAIEKRTDDGVLSPDVEKIYIRYYYESELKSHTLLRKQRRELTNYDFGRMGAKHIAALDSRLVLVEIEAIVRRVEAEAAGIKTAIIEEYYSKELQR